MRGYFEIGIYQGKNQDNLGTLWRSAYQLGANGIFTIGKRYKLQCSDTYKSFRHIPLRQFDTEKEFLDSLPYDCRLIGIEMGGQPLSNFSHFQRCIYLLGSEDGGLPQKILDKCHYVVSIESIRVNSYNVAIAGALVMYHRYLNLL